MNCNLFAIYIVGSSTIEIGKSRCKAAVMGARYGEISYFCERWQPETTTFHLPFGEMTITLDDVASILHIPVIGSMISFSPLLRVDDANALLVELLGTTDIEASRETEQCRSPSVRLLGCFLLRICRTPSHDHVHYVRGRT